MRKHAVQFFLPLALLLVSTVTLAFDKGDDIAGAKDIAEAERYPWSRIDRYSEISAPNYHQMLGVLEKVRGQVKAEKDRRVAGQLTRITYQVPEGEGSEAPFIYMRGQLQEQGIATLFQCAGRSCGSSSYWANDVFSNATLYGPDDDQFYWAGEGIINGKEYTYSLYAIERGNRRIYLQLDRLEKTSSASSTGKQGANGSIVLSDLVYRGVQLDDSSVEKLILVAQELKDTDGAIVLVGHYYEPGKTIEEQTKIGRQRAEAVKSVLRVNGVSESRMQFYSVGPLAPRQQAPYQLNRVEILFFPG